MCFYNKKNNAVPGLKALTLEKTFLLNLIDVASVNCIESRADGMLKYRSSEPYERLQLSLHLYFVFVSVGCRRDRHVKRYCPFTHHTTLSPLSIRSAARRSGLRRRMNNELNFPPNFERLVLGCIDADFCK